MIEIIVNQFSNILIVTWSIQTKKKSHLLEEQHTQSSNQAQNCTNILNLR